MRLHKPTHTWHCLYQGTTVRCVGCDFEKQAKDLTPNILCGCRTPTVTQYYCDVCGVFATSEEQLVMHNEGKKHKRTVALKELTEGHLPSGPSNTGADADGEAAQTGALLLFVGKGTAGRGGWGS